MRKSKTGRKKKIIQQLCQHCSVNTWAVQQHLGVFVTAVTHHCLMKLETQRNTNLDIAGYLYDIGHVKLTAAVCLCKHLPVCIPNNGFFVEVLHALQLRQRSSCQCKFFLQYYLIIQIWILSFSSVTVECEVYALIISSFQVTARARGHWELFMVSTELLDPSG